MLINLIDLQKEFNLKIDAVLHIGAHHGEESSIYKKVGIEKVLWIEADPNTYKVLKEKIIKNSSHKAFNLLVSDCDGEEVEFNVATFSQSSSMLQFGTMKNNYPEIKHEDTILLTTTRLDSFFLKENIRFDFDLVNLDIQGAELLALKGMGDFLNKVKYIYSEVNIANVYQGCSKLFMLDFYLAKKGFIRKEMILTSAYWGDAFYTKGNVFSLRFLNNISEALFLELKAEIKLLRDRFYKFRHNLS